ncbi:MAG TPA: PAS domain-containing sensor histidine kinase [Rhodocyclaceae bacterium]|nr:PAS domain-containing sensor histidine kinase [Rhodocyclaceae bacterium]
MNAVPLSSLPSDPAAAQVSPRGAALWRERLDLLLESTGEGVFGVDMQGNCIFINRAAAEMIGYTADEAMHKNMHYLIHHSHNNGTHYPVEQCPIFHAFSHGLPCHIEDEVLWRKDGTSFQAEYTSHPIVERTPDGKEVILGAVATIKNITERKQAEALLRQTNDELERRVRERTSELTSALADLRQLAAYLETVRETERTRIAREIHDELGSLLVALKMDVNWLTKRVDDRPPLVEKCKGMGNLIDTAVENVGRIITDLRPSILDHQGLWAALAWQAQEIIKSAELTSDVQMHIAAGVETPERSQATAVFRVFQEILSNVARHSRAQAIHIRVFVDQPPDPVLYIEVRDNGVGATREELNSPQSYGVAGMRERAAHFGGKLTIDGLPGQGTSVKLVMPLQTEPA